MRTRLAILAAVYFLAHLPFLPPTLGDLDSINFALGVRDFDIAQHQPHPPGYPIFIALAKGATAALRALHVPAPEPRALALLSAISGGALLPVLFLFFRAIDGNSQRAGWASAVVVASPLVWFSALRPLSDMMGLALVVGTLALLASVLFARPGHAPNAGARLLAAAFLAGLAIGVRAQSFVLTLPLLALTIITPAYPIAWRHRLVAPFAFAIGALAWAVPLLVATGGLGSYLSTLGAQGGEDLGGVPILWTMRTAAILKESLLNTYLWPWGGLVIGGVVVAAAAIGAARVAWQMPRVLLVLAVAFGPYAVFHPLFHDVANVRNALPLVPPVAYLAVLAFDAAGAHVLRVAAVGLIVVGLSLAVPASAGLAREGSPTFRMLNDIRARRSESKVLGMHAVFRRAVDWSPPLEGSRLLIFPHGREWLRLIEHWRAHPDVPAWFAADPKRSDLVLFDPASRSLIRSYRWPFVEPPYVGGARPGNADWYDMAPPGWMLDRGWALTAEIGGVTARDSLGPHRQPSVAWVRRRDADAVLVIGGRHLSAADPAVTISLTLDGVALAAFDVTAGSFVRRIDVPAARLGGHVGYGRLEIASKAADGSGRVIPVALEQFNLQSPGVPVLALEAGWYEPEYNMLRGTAWLWMSDRAELWVRPVGRDVTLRMTGESPRHYYDDTPQIRVQIGDATIAEFAPSSDFAQDVVLPHAALAAAAGRVIVTSSQHFVPGEREGTADRRRLALRLYTVEVR